MNSKRRADLQRKLSMGAVPRPPEGLAQRIKDDIPKYLQAEQERQRFSRNVAFSMRIAASILLLITSLFVTLNLLESDAPMQMTASRQAEMQKAVLRDQAAASSETVASAPQPASDEIRVDMIQDMPAATAQPAPLDQRYNEDAGRRDRAGLEEKADDAGGWTANQETSVGRVAQEQAFAYAPQVAEAPAVAPPPPPSRSAPEPVPAPAPVAAPPPVLAAAEAERQERPAAKTAARTAAPSPSLVKEAYAAELDLDAKKDPFGITVDPTVFHRIKASIESGEAPSGRSVDVEALVNYFAGAPSRPPRRGVRLEVEASPAAIESDGERAVLRVTVDTARPEAATEGSLLPAARDVRIEIDINREVVAHVRRIGDGDALPAEPLLLPNLSVTALYELELKSPLKSSSRVATVRLHHSSLTNGRPQSDAKVIHGHDLTRTWSRASRRHRLATLGALWGESLQKGANGNGRGTVVARRAEELVTQDPADPLARELAEATAGGRQ